MTRIFTFTTLHPINLRNHLPPGSWLQRYPWETVEWHNNITQISGGCSQLFVWSTRSFGSVRLDKLHIKLDTSGRRQAHHSNKHIYVLTHIISLLDRRPIQLNICRNSHHIIAPHYSQSPGQETNLQKITFQIQYIHCTLFSHYCITLSYPSPMFD